ncbi:hypothetical protein ISN76_13130 [Dyella halodurans]|uniref:Uncharacterized protein n=1 Tax=Dyella halodurans TaxID=1920171 RepID=A0ABV9C0G1_9GAMM|nr:hypothetical protein [Dyella halodurans]
MKKRTFRCRICRLVDGVMQTITYIGPVDQTPAGWSIKFRALVTTGGRAA